MSTSWHEMLSVYLFILLIKHCGAESGIFLDTQGNAMAIDAFVPCVVRS